MGVGEVPERPAAPATTSCELQLRAASTHYNCVSGILPGTVMLLTRGKAKTRGPILTQGRERKGIKTLKPLAQSQLGKLVHFDTRSVQISLTLQTLGVSKISRLT